MDHDIHTFLSQLLTYGLSQTTTAVHRRVSSMVKDPSDRVVFKYLAPVTKAQRPRTSLSIGLDRKDMSSSKIWLFVVTQFGGTGSEHIVKFEDDIEESGK
jgi:hypothetical protein